MRVLQVSHGGEWNLHHAVNTVVSFLHPRRQHSDYLKADAVYADVLTHSFLAGKQLDLGFGANNAHPSLSQFVFFAEELTLRQPHCLDLEHAGIESLDVEA